MAEKYLDSKTGRFKDEYGRDLGANPNLSSLAVAEKMKESPAARSKAQVKPTDEAPPKQESGESLAAFAARRKKWQSDRAKMAGQKDALGSI